MTLTRFKHIQNRMRKNTLNVLVHPLYIMRTQDEEFKAEIGISCPATVTQTKSRRINAKTLSTNNNHLNGEMYVYSFYNCAFALHYDANPIFILSTRNIIRLRWKSKVKTFSQCWGESSSYAGRHTNAESSITAQDNRRNTCTIEVRVDGWKFNHGLQLVFILYCTVVLKVL